MGAGLSEIHARIAPRFARSEPRERVADYVGGLLAPLELGLRPAGPGRIARSPRSSGPGCSGWTCSTSSIACRSRHRPDPSPPSRRRDPSTVRSPDPRVDRPSRPPGVRGARRRRRAPRHCAGGRPRPGRTARSARAGASPGAGLARRDRPAVLRSSSVAVTSRPVSSLIAVDAVGRPCGGPVVVAHDPVQNRARRDAPGPPADGGVSACGCAPGRLSRVRPSSS